MPVHLLQLDTDHLAQAAACGDQEFHDGFLFVGLAAIPQLLQLLGSQGTPGPHPVDLQGFDLTCGIFLDDLFHLKPAEKGAQGIDMGLDAALLQFPFLGQIADVTPDIIGGDLRDVLVNLGGKGIEHLPVVFQRLGGQAVNFLGNEEGVELLFQIAAAV